MPANTLLDSEGLSDWFVREVLPLEPMLTRFLRRSWHDKAEISDLRQETYVRIFQAAQREIPNPVKPYLFLTARNLMIDRLRKKSVVSIETRADMDWATFIDQAPSPEQSVSAMQDFHRMQEALDDLPPRCRQVILLRRVHGLSQKEVAQKMGIKEQTVETQVKNGIRILANALSDRRGALRSGARRFGAKRDWPFHK